MNEPLQQSNANHHSNLKGSFTERDFSYQNEWVVQDSMDVFTLCNCDSITSSYAAHCNQKLIAVANFTISIGLKAHSHCTITTVTLYRHEWVVQDSAEELTL